MKTFSSKSGGGRGSPLTHRLPMTSDRVHPGCSSSRHPRTLWTKGWGLGSSCASTTVPTLSVSCRGDSSWQYRRGYSSDSSSFNDCPSLPSTSIIHTGHRGFLEKEVRILTPKTLRRQMAPSLYVSVPIGLVSVTLLKTPTGL